jgi:hypothetical protein
MATGDAEEKKDPVTADSSLAISPFSIPSASLQLTNMSEKTQGQRHDRTALILYGSETGNSQDVAEELGRVAERLHFVTRVREMDLVAIVCLLISHSGVRLDAHLYPIERINRLHRCHIRNFNNWSGRIPQEFKEVLEKSSAEAFASWMS